MSQLCPNQAISHYHTTAPIHHCAALPLVRLSLSRLHLPTAFLALYTDSKHSNRYTSLLLYLRSIVDNCVAFHNLRCKVAAPLNIFSTREISPRLLLALYFSLNPPTRH